MKASRRRFITNAAKALGGFALVQPIGGWTFAARRPSADLIHRSMAAMGTSIRLSLLESEFTGNAARNAFERIADVDRLLTVHNAASALMQVNGGAAVSGSEISDVARAALHFGSLTEGAMDVTVLPALRRLGFVPGATGHDLIDYSLLDVNGTTVRMRSSDVGADFGGIAKGYGVDQAVSAAQKAGVSAALLDAGGDLFALGRPDADRPWKVGVRHPEKDNDLVATLEVEDEAVATSGITMQTKVIDGKTVSHLIDPRTGQPVNHVVSATIVARDTMTADALATAVSVARRSQGQHLVESQPDVEGFLIYADGTSFTSKGLQNRLRLL